MLGACAAEAIEDDGCCDPRLLPTIPWFPVMGAEADGAVVTDGEEPIEDAPGIISGLGGMAFMTGSPTPLLLNRGCMLFIDGMPPLAAPIGLCEDIIEFGLPELNP